MPKTSANQGYSLVTPYKQHGFAKILTVIKNIAYFGSQKHKNLSQFLYIDCNSGCGSDPLAGRGSPIIATDLLVKHIKIGREKKVKSFDRKALIFCDKNEKNIEQLRNHLKKLDDCFFFCGDNNSQEFYDFCTFILTNKFDVNYPLYGLIYADPNASLDYPIDNINRFSANPRLNMVDVLINFNTGQIKRNRRAFIDDYEHQRRHLKKVIDSINKKKVLVRRHYSENNPFKFAHFFFTNYVQFKKYKAIDLFELETTEGQNIFNELCFTKQELEENCDRCDRCGEILTSSNNDFCLFNLCSYCGYVKQ